MDTSPLILSDNCTVPGALLRVRRGCIPEMVRPRDLENKSLWVKRAREMAGIYFQVSNGIARGRNCYKEEYISCSLVTLNDEL